MSKVRLIAADLDDTLLDGEGKLSITGRRAVDHAVAAGIEFVIASGRSFYCLPDEMRDIPGVRYAICSNGANVFDLPEKKCLRSFLLKTESVRRIRDIARQYRDAYLDAFHEGEAHSQREYLENALNNPEVTPHRRAYLLKTRNPEDDIDAYIRSHEDSLDCMNIISYNPETRRRALQDLAAVPDIYVTSSIDSLIEISYKESGKQRGLQWLCETLHISPADTVAFGNADNDAAMLAFAGCGIAVANASESCKAAADRVIGPNDRDSAAAEILRIVQEDL